VAVITFLLGGARSGKSEVGERILAGLPPDTFEVVVTGDSVSRGKPHPEPYLTATDILGVGIPRVTVALNPGKNITVMSEVVAMMHLLRYSGVDVASAFNERLIKKMKEQRGVREYLQNDYE